METAIKIKLSLQLSERFGLFSVSNVASINLKQYNFCLFQLISMVSWEMLFKAQQIWIVPLLPVSSYTTFQSASQRECSLLTLSKPRRRSVVSVGYAGASAKLKGGIEALREYGVRRSLERDCLPQKIFRFSMSKWCNLVHFKMINSKQFCVINSCKKTHCMEAFSWILKTNFKLVTINPTTII